VLDHTGFTSNGKKKFKLNLICEEDTVSNKKRKLPEGFCEDKQCDDKKPKLLVEKQCDDKKPKLLVEKQCDDKKPKLLVEKQCDDTLLYSLYTRAHKRVAKFFDYFR